MATVIRDEDVDFSALLGRSAAVVGPGAHALPLALCLRDRGVDVRVGLAADDAGFAAAESEGMAVRPAVDAVEETDLVVLVGPSEVVRAAYDTVVRPNLAAGDALILPSGLLLQRHGLTLPAGVDVCVVAPQASPPVVRARFADGAGVPALVAVHRDASGKARDTALAYAAAIGATRAGVLLTTVPEQAQAASLASRTVGPAGLGPVLQGTYDVLVRGGVDRDVAYLSCITAVRQATELLLERGLAGLTRAGSNGAGWLPAEVAREHLDRSWADMRDSGDKAPAADWRTAR